MKSTRGLALESPAKVSGLSYQNRDINVEGYFSSFKTSSPRMKNLFPLLHGPDCSFWLLQFCFVLFLFFFWWFLGCVVCAANSTCRRSWCDAKNWPDWNIMVRTTSIDFKQISRTFKVFFKDNLHFWRTKIYLINRHSLTPFDHPIG